MAAHSTTLTARARVAIVACLVGLSACCRAAAQAPPAPVTRVVSLVPAVTEMLFAMGAGDEVVGVSSYDDYPPAVRTRPRVGALVDPDLERIMTLKPDLVVVYGTQSDLIDRLTHAHIAMFNYEHAGLADITTTIRTIGTRVGHASAADALASAIERDLAGIRSAVAGASRPKTALIFGREPGALRGIFASGGVGFLHDMLETAGGDDVFGDVRQQSLQVSTELLLARAPDVILEIRPTESWTPALIAREVAVWRQLPAVPAVRTGRVYMLADDRLLIPGPRVAEAVRLMAHTLHGDRVK